MLLPPLCVFPLHKILLDGSCGCGQRDCDRVGKHPMVRWSKLEQGEKLPIPVGHGHGIATGYRSNVVVIDLDVRPGKNGHPAKNGIQELAKLGDAPDTYTVFTPTGGLHLYYAYPHDLEPHEDISCSAGALGPGIDVRGNGGYVVGPGSPHENGGAYKCNANDVQPLPTWLRRLVVSSKRDILVSDAPRPIAETHSQWAYRVGVAAKAIAAAPGRGEAQGSTLWGLCLTLVRELELPLDTAHDLLAAYAAANGWKSHELQRKLTEARDNSDAPCGTWPKGQLERISEIVTPALARAPESPAVTVVDRTYSHEPGDAPSTQVRSTTISDLIGAMKAHPQWQGVWRFNEFANRIEARNPPLRLYAEGGELKPVDITAIRTWFEANGISAGKADVRDAIEATAHQAPYHPVREYLDSLPICEDPELVFNGLAKRILRCEGTALEEKFLRVTLIGAVKRIYEPGAKFDTMLILYGRQGVRKSSFIKALFGGGIEGRVPFVLDQMPSLEGRDSSIMLEGTWAVEFPEVDKLLSSHSHQTIKDFLSRSVDSYREFKERDKVVWPRQNIFIGTTNEVQLLSDSTGDRRYLPIHTSVSGGKIDIDYVLENRDLIWAAALACLRAGEVCHLDNVAEDGAVRARGRFEVEDPWEGAIEAYCQGRESVVPLEIFESRIAAGVEGVLLKWDRKSQMRIADTLRRLGCAPVRVTQEGQKKRVWSTSEDMRSATPTLREQRARSAAAAK